jgi:hypothetical protein
MWLPFARYNKRRAKSGSGLELRSYIPSYGAKGKQGRAEEMSVVTVAPFLPNRLGNEGVVWGGRRVWGERAGVETISLSRAKHSSLTHAAHQFQP